MRFHYDCGENGRHQRHAGAAAASASVRATFDFDFGEGPGGWGGGRRGRERKRMFEGGELRLVLLEADRRRAAPRL